MSHRFLYIMLFFLAFGRSSQAQDGQRISGNYSGISFDKLVHEIESQTNYYFYYDSTETDSLQVTVAANALTLQQLLDLAFKNTDLQFSVRDGKKVFVSKQYRIATALPDHFFEGEKPDSTGLPVARFKSENTSGVTTGARLLADKKLYDIGINNGKPAPAHAVLSGYVRDGETGEPIVGASMTADSSTVSIATDPFGFYKITLVPGHHVLHISSAGMKDTRRQLVVYGNGSLNVELEEFVASLKTVIVSADKTSNIRQVGMGANKLNIQTIRQLPAVLGEVDVLKAMITLPGVTSVGEGSNGFNVRGGAADQNLILYNDATVYNPNHLFGFFAAFDPNLVKSVELFKSSIPEKYGGRLSSVMNVDVKDGNNKKWTGSAGISPLTSTVSIEGPIVKEKTSIIAGFRTTYSDWLLHQLPASSYSNSSADFYDGSVHITHILNAKNTLYLMGYMSRDRFSFDADTNYSYSNANANLKWKHSFSNRSYAVFTTGIDHYQYSIGSTQVPTAAYSLNFAINQTYLRAEFNYTPSAKHSISYGINAVYYQLKPGSLVPDGAQSEVIPDNLPKEQGLESAIYLGDHYTISEKLAVDAGVRYNIYNYLGPSTVYNYVPGLPRTTYRITDSVIYPKGKIIKTYSIPDIRFSARYTLDASSSLKVSLNTTSQFIHVISNTANISPVDIWKLSDPHIQPQKGQQVSLGYYRNFNSNSIETSVEVYYKRMQDYLDYKNGADLVLNHHIETDVFETEGKAYGVELMVKKTAGKLNGWVSYTYSRTFLKQDDPLAGQVINPGSYYPASFDKPNIANVIANYRFSHRYSASVNMTYSTGRPITLPIGVIHQGGTSVPIYSERNEYRIPDYFRTDVSVNMTGNSNKKQTFHGSWSLGVYNVTGRHNVYSIYFADDGSKIKGYQLSIFGSAIPFITYNIRF